MAMTQTFADTDGCDYTVAMQDPITSLLRAPAGPITLADFDTRATTGFPSQKGKAAAASLTETIAPILARQQEQLFAQGRADHGARRVLLVLQGMDTSGKGGVISNVIGMVNPQGVQITAFTSPTPEELAHDFLWRINNAKPGAGMIGIFDRSHYEDVLIARVNNLVPEATWQARYQQINDWEAAVVNEENTTIIKCFLHLSKDEQKQRLAKRLENPAKYWKYNPSDLEARAHWDEYQTAYEAALTNCNTEAAPWYIVPADRKWYRNWAIAEILTQTLGGLGLEWPPAQYDVAAEQARVAAS
ncbi:MAG: PPK2 family polyphosphate kinase [Propionibacteriaceae bacterium]